MPKINDIIDNLGVVRENGNSLGILMDFERVLDQLDIYTYKNWYLGELVDGPKSNRYFVTASFMWPDNLPPDARALKKLKNFGILHKVKLDEFHYTLRPKSYEDFESGSFMPKTTQRPVWVVELKIPKDLMQQIETGYAEIEGQQIDLQDLDSAYEDNLDKEMVKNDEQDQLQQSAQPAQ
jgi:hypothetical protein